MQQNFVSSPTMTCPARSPTPALTQMSFVYIESFHTGMEPSLKVW